MAYQPQNINGQATMANSEPVVIASNQTSIPVTMSNTLALTDTQLRATPVPITMSNTLALTDTQLRATPIPTTGVVTGNSLVSTANSTAVALGINGVFTGTSEDITEFSTIMITVFSDQASAVDGLSIQQSSNGTNWDLSDVLTVPINSGKTFSFGAQSRFFRVVYTNGATASTVLRLQTIYSKNAKKNSSVRPQDARGNDNDFEEALSFLMGYNSATNVWDRLRSTTTKGLDVNPTELRASTLAVTTTAAAGTAVTLTIPAVVGQFHYITSLDIKLYSAAARVGAAAPTVVTTTNLPGAIAFTFSTAGAIGTIDIQDLIRTTPLRSSALNTATTVVCPIAAGGIWRITATYFTGV